MDGQPTAETIELVKDIPIYRRSVEQGHFPLLEKPEIARGFPDNWMTPRLAAALAGGEAEFVLSTGTNHARMQIIRPPYFLLHSYYKLWSEHPDLAGTWEDGCRRVSLTTVLATEHVARVNAAKRGGEPDPAPSFEDRRLDERTCYVNLRLDPELWDRGDCERMIEEISGVREEHPQGRYLLDCSAYHLAHLVRKAKEWDLLDAFPPPAGIIHAYEYAPLNVRRFLREHFDCPLIDLFGSTELGYLFYSDSTGAYRPYLHDMSLELLPVAPGNEIFELIVSSVRNPHMPLIRYRSGDCVRTQDGTSDPAKIMQFCGRAKELLTSPRGPVSQGELDERIAEASARVFVHQLHVTEPGTARLDCTTFDGAPLGDAETAALADGVGELIGRRCRVEHRHHIPIGKSGKYAWLVQAPEPRRENP
ncbi:hypothetical protein [Streptomyces sp. bgisy100]|uniref:hypothetical protein n=1 Tax=Streptomyces sp. bgisy100 TaxID=3413783 RepID=UPI003D75292B